MISRFKFAAALAILTGASLALAQQQPLTVMQQVRIAGLENSLDAQIAAVNAARTELTAAALATPANRGAIDTRARALAEAEMALAIARADVFASFQASADRLSPTQAADYRDQRAGAAGGGGRGGFGGGSPEAAYGDYSGFTALFDGRTLNGWDYESDVWSIDNGYIHADTTLTPGQHHIHYIGPGHILRDFEFKVEFKISATGANGGIQYRSRLLNAAHRKPAETPLDGNSRNHMAAVADPRGQALPAGITTLAQAQAAGINGNPWQISGYQFDLDSNNRFTGQLYEGQGRGIVTAPGSIVRMMPNGVNFRIGSLTDDSAVQDAIHPHNGLDGDWQQVHIIAHGNTLIHIINGRVISVTIDDDPKRRALQGILSLQLEGSGQVWYRNVYLRNLGE